MTDELSAAKRWNAEARQLHAQGRTPEALQPARAALDIVERIQGENHPDTTNVRIGLSIVCEQLSLYAEAEEQARKAVRATEDGPAGLRMHALARLAVSVRISGNLASAENLYQQALEHATTDAEKSALWCGLGIVYKYAKRYDEAEKLYRDALALVNPDGPAAASLWHNLGGLDHARRRYASGEPAARRSVRIRVQSLGPDHPTVAADLAALASLLCGQRKYVEAERLYRQALAVFRAVYGEDNFETAVTYNDLGALEAARGNIGKACRYYEKSVAVKRRIFGDGHPEVALTERNLAFVTR